MYKLKISEKRITIITLALSVSLVGVFLQLQNDVTVDPDANNDNKKFNHPFMQLLFMFIGESLALVFYGYKYARKYAAGTINTGMDYQYCLDNGYKMNISIFMFLPGAILDALGTIFMLISVLEMKIGLSQLVTSFDIIVIAILSKYLFGSKLYRHNYFGLALQFIAIFAISVFLFVLDLEKVGFS